MARRDGKKLVTGRPLSAESRVVILQGPEAFLRAEYVQKLVSLLESAHGSIDRFGFDGATATVAEVLDECRSFGLMAGHKLVVVEDAEGLLNATTRPMFERYASEPSEGATLVLKSGKWHRGKLDELVERSGTVIRCEEPDESTALAWAQARSSKRHGAELERDAGALLVERVGAQLGRLDAELGKLAAAAGGGPITRGLVAEFVGVSREERVFGVQRALAQGDVSGALRQLRESVDRSGESPVLASWACMDYARKLHGAAASGPAAMKVMRVWPREFQEELVRAGGRLGARKTLAGLDAAVAADWAQKSGLGRDAMRTLERLLVTLCV